MEGHILSGFLDLVIQAISTPDQLSYLRSDVREVEPGLDTPVPVIIISLKRSHSKLGSASCGAFSKISGLRRFNSSARNSLNLSHWADLYCGTLLGFLGSVLRGYNAVKGAEICLAIHV